MGQGHGTTKRLRVNHKIVKRFPSPHLTNIPSGLQDNNSGLQLEEQQNTDSKSELCGSPK